VRGPLALLIVLAVVAFLVYATVVPHAQRPCLITRTNPCRKQLQETGK
jgi:hypothetical protein